jgi:hypothetical protein
VKPTVEAAYYNHVGTRAFDKYNRLIALSVCINLHYFTQIIVTTLYMYKNNKIYFKNLRSVAGCLHLGDPE